MADVPTVVGAENFLGFVVEVGGFLTAVILVICLAGVSIEDLEVGRSAFIGATSVGGARVVSCFRAGASLTGLIGADESEPDCTVDWTGGAADTGAGRIGALPFPLMSLAFIADAGRKGRSSAGFVCCSFFWLRIASLIDCFGRLWEDVALLGATEAFFGFDASCCKRFWDLASNEDMML